MDEIRAVAGPIVQRYFEKVEQEREAARVAEEAEQQRKRDMAEAAKQSALAMENAENDRDAEMTDANETPKEGEVEEK
jgi:heat shock protein 4